MAYDMAMSHGWLLDTAATTRTMNNTDCMANICECRRNMKVGSSGKAISVDFLRRPLVETSTWERSGLHRSLEYKRPVCVTVEDLISPHTGLECGRYYR